MRAVLYTYDLQPITVLEVPEWARERIERCESFRMYVPERPIRDYGRVDSPTTAEMRIVRIHTELMRRNGWNHPILFTEDEESALLLRAAFLPGQLGELQKQNQDYFSKGFWSAIQLGSDL